MVYIRGVLWGLRPEDGGRAIGQAGGLLAVSNYTMVQNTCTCQWVRTYVCRNFLDGERRGAEPLAGSVRACPESIEGVSLTQKDLSGGWVGNVNVC